MDYPKRKRLRLPNYDYSSDGAYFLTICTKDRAPILSEISETEKNGETVATVTLTQTGAIVQQYLLSISNAYPYISVDTYVLMPDHVHILLRVTSAPTRCVGSAKQPSVIARTVAAFKRLTNQKCRQSLWQDGYYDHIIRDAQDYQRRAEYIETNPLRRILKEE